MMFRRMNLVVGALLFATSLAPAATITGTVKGPDGAPFRGAFVQAQNLQTKITVIVLSGPDGSYHVNKLPAGDYTVKIRAVGFKADPRTGVKLTSDQNASMDFALDKGVVRWNDLSYLQGKVLFPEGKGKQELVTTCFGCHGFETRMASVHRDADGWVDRVNYMKEITHFATAPGFTDEKAASVAAYLNTLFGDAIVLPKSPSDVSGYEATVRKFPSDEAMKIVYVEYDMPGPSRMPWDANPAKSGKVWIPEFSPFNGIASLNPDTGKFEEYKEPETHPAFTHSVVEAPDGSAWLTEQSTNKIGRWDPVTKQITEYQDALDPTKVGLRSAGSKHTIRVDSKGMVWASGTPFSKFDPKTGKFTDLPVAPNTYGVEKDKFDNIWFDGFTPDGKLFKVDGETGKITGYQPPTAGLPRRITPDSDGIVYFCEFRAGKIGRFDPKTETFKEYTLPGPDASPYALGIDKNHYIWYSSEQMDVVGRLDPKTGEVIEYPFPQSENAMREFIPDDQGRMWFGSAPNNKVGYFYVADK